jgi:cation transport regulator ChaB
MPYATNEELPEAIKDSLPGAAQTVFRNVVNSQLKRGLSESRSFASAWSTLERQGWEKGEEGKWHKLEKVSMDDDFLISGEIMKSDEDQRLVFGWASVVTDLDGNAVSDYQGDIIRPEELEKAAYAFVHDVRKAGEMHQRTEGVGQLVESVVLTKEKQAAIGIPEGSVPEGWWVGFKLAQDVFDKVKSGEYKMFSIGGSGVRREIKDA